MLRHYLTFAHQAAALDEALRGWTLAECWSQEKNVLALRFIKERESRFVEASLDPLVGFALMRPELHRARRNTIDFFELLLGVQLASVGIDDRERVIRMRFVDGHELAFFFFGGGGGNVLLLRDGGIDGSFMKYSGEYDSLLTGSADEEIRSPEGIRELLRTLEEPPARALMRAIPELGRRLAEEALHRVGLAGTSLRDRSDPELDRLLEEVDVLYGACEGASTFYIYHLPGEVIFSLVELTGVASRAERIETFDAIDRAVRTYRSAFHHGREFTVLRDRIVKRLHGELGKLERALTNRLGSTSNLEKKEEWEEVGKLLMANLTAIPKGSASVRLHGWDGAEREIALDTKLSPLENAERYFRRARGAREGAERAVKGVEKNHAMLDRVARLLAEAERATSVEELERIEKNNRDLFVMSAEAKEPGSAERFRRFELAGGHEAFAGKNASNNDELTVRFARPNDYWFHARGSSGSHVVLRWNDPKTKPPRDVLRAAASIAAYYSGARGAKMVPVAYTLKKYVRKPRGAAPGSVVMEREEVVMVEPRLPYGES
jgi:predicted ribosome quality control (RQC) complex YloA/Tae2 family protein